MFENSLLSTGCCIGIQFSMMLDSGKNVYLEYILIDPTIRFRMAAVKLQLRAFLNLLSE